MVLILVHGLVTYLRLLLLTMSVASDLIALDSWTPSMFNVNKTVSIHLVRGINHYRIITWTISISHHMKLDHNQQMPYNNSLPNK